MPQCVSQSTPAGSGREGDGSVLGSSVPSAMRYGYDFVSRARALSLLAFSSTPLYLQVFSVLMSSLYRGWQWFLVSASQWTVMIACRLQFYTFGNRGQEILHIFTFLCSGERKIHCEQKRDDLCFLILCVSI